MTHQGLQARLGGWLGDRLDAAGHVTARAAGAISRSSAGTSHPWQVRAKSARRAGFPASVNTMSFPSQKASLACSLSIVVALMGLTACGSPAPATSTSEALATASPSQESKAPELHRLEMEVTGTVASLSLTFELDGKVSEEKAGALPWRKTVEVPFGTGTHEWKLTMQHNGGNLSASAITDGELVTRTAGSGSPGSNNSATLKGSFSD